MGRPFQRSHVNTEAKYLMMRHAFEVWGCVRVELKTNVLNRRSRDAMLRIGCVEEGMLRNLGISDAGVPRDTVYYSVIDREWPAVKAKLEAHDGPRLADRPCRALLHHPEREPPAPGRSCPARPGDPPCASARLDVLNEPSTTW